MTRTTIIALPVALALAAGAVAQETPPAAAPAKTTKIAATAAR